MSQVQLRIGNYTFALAPQNEMDFDFTRAIPKLDTAGAPTYQDFGIDEKKLDFSGALVGSDAWTQAELLESMMDSGQPVALSYGPIQRTVRIESLQPKLRRFDHVLYDISLIIIPPTSGFQAPPPTVTITAIAPVKAAPPVTSTASIQQYATKTVTVKQGDTLWAIAQREYGDGSQWPVIAKANGITNERSLQTGQVLKIPPMSNLQAANNAYVARRTASVTSSGISYLQAKEAAVRFQPHPVAI